MAGGESFDPEPTPGTVAPAPPDSARSAEAPKKPRRKKRCDRSFDLLTRGGEWVARIWAEDSGTAWGLANTAFPAFYEKPSAFDIEPASAKYAQDVANCCGKRLRDITWESGADRGRERFYMASADEVGIPTGAPVPDGRTLEEQGYVAGVGEVPGTTEARGLHGYDVNLEDDGSGNPTFLGNVHALDLPTAGIKAQEKFQGSLNGNPRLVVTPSKGFLEGMFTEISECVGCGRRWPKAESVGCPTCVHGPAVPMPAPSPAVPMNWRDSPPDVLGSEFADGLFDSEVDTLGEAWDLLESGALVEQHEWSVADAKALEAALVKLRHEAGDPAPNTAPIEDAPAKPARKPPRKTFRLVYRDDDSDQPIDCGEFKARDSDEAQSRIPELCRHESVRLADGRVVAMNLARVEAVQVPAAPRKRKEVPV